MHYNIVFFDVLHGLYQGVEPHDLAIGKARGFGLLDYSVGHHLQHNTATLGNGDTISPDLQPAPPPGHHGRAAWKTPSGSVGPVGLMLFSVSQNAGAFDRDFRLHRHGQQPLECITMPYQAVQPHLEAVAVQGRIAHVAQTRTAMEGVGDIDRDSRADRPAERRKELKPQILPNAEIGGIPEL